MVHTNIPQRQTQVTSDNISRPFTAHTPPQFENWINELYDDFGHEAPTKGKASSILLIVQKALGLNIKEYIGSGDNGVVFGTNKGTVVKFTIDNKEALLWSRLIGVNLPGIARCHNVYHLFEQRQKEQIPTIVYLVHVDFIPHNLSTQQSNAIKKANQEARQDLKQRMTGRSVQEEERHYLRTLSFVKAFNKIAKK